MRKSTLLKLAYLTAMLYPAGKAAMATKAGTTTAGVGSSLSAKAAAAGVGTGGMAPAPGLKYGLGAAKAAGTKTAMSSWPYKRLALAREFLRRRRH